MIPACKRRGSLRLQKAIRLCISACLPIAVSITYVSRKAGESILWEYTVECCVTGQGNIVSVMRTGHCAVRSLKISWAQILEPTNTHTHITENSLSMILQSYFQICPDLKYDTAAMLSLLPVRWVLPTRWLLLVPSMLALLVP